MKTIRGLVWPVYFVGLLGIATGGEARVRPLVAAAPAARVAPAGDTLLLVAHAWGALAYRCTELHTGSGVAAHGWVLSGVQATLHDDRGAVIGHQHQEERLATWQLSDGTVVTGTMLREATPDPTALPRQRFDAVATERDGLFSAALLVQRVYTAGASAPSRDCSAETVGAGCAVDYRADDYFFTRP